METHVQDALAHTSPNVTLGADVTVQWSVTSVLHSFSGEPLTGVALAQPHDRPGEIFTPMSLPIDARVTPKLKAKMWANEFINFWQLITVTPNDEKFNISINTSTESPGQPTLCLEPLQKAKNISTIAAWTSAFQVFVGIYTSKFPAEAPALMKYGEVVRDLADKGANWIYYDTNFRYLRQQKSADFPWGTIHFELWIRSQQFPRKNTNVPLGVALMCLLAIVANITEEVTVRVVHLNMNVINVIKTIQAPSVIFVPQDLSPSVKPSLALPTPVTINGLAPLLSGYSTSTAEYLINGFSLGFPIPFQGPSSSSSSPNLLSAEQHPGVIDHYLTKELLAQRVAGPFTHPPFQNFRLSPIGVVPKKTPGEFRCIQHLSYPYGASVNDGIPVEDSNVTYSRIDDAVGLILRSGVGSFLAKTDIKSAFRIISSRPADYHLLGIYWRGNYYFDRCWPMGLASSCKTFEALSTAVQWTAQNKLGISYMLHLLDDFLIISGSHEQCSREQALSWNSAPT